MGRFFRWFSFSMIACILLLFLLVRVFGVFRMPFTSVDAYELIPNTSALLFEIQDWHGLHQQLQAQSYAEAIEQVELTAKLTGGLADLDTLLSRSKIDEHALRAGRIVAALQVSNAGSMDYLIVLDQHPFDLSASTIATYLPDYEITRNRFRNRSILELKAPDGAQMALCFLPGALVIAPYAFLVEGAIQQLNTPTTSISRKGTYKQMKPLAGFQGDLAMYIQIDQLPLLSSALVHSSRVDQTDPIRQFGSWMALDLFLKENELLFEGFTLPDVRSRGAVLAQQTHKTGNQLSQVLPDHSGLVYALRTDGLRTWIYSDDRSIAPEIEEYLLPWVGDELAFVQLDPLSAEVEKDQLALFHIRNEDLFNELMLDLLNQAGEISVEDYANFRIRQVNLNDLLLPFLGSAFNSIQQPYFVQVEEYAVFANSSAALKKTLDRYLTGRTLGRNFRFQEFSLNQTTDGNAWLYLDPGFLFQAYSAIAKESFKPDLSEHFQHISKFNPVSFRWSGFENKFLTEGRIGFENTNLSRSSLVWRTSLEAPAQIAPTLVRNHRTGAWEILIQDTNNRIYQLSANGSINWSKPLDGPILSEIYQVDLYRNDKLQYLFNTRDNIHGIDREGDDVKGKGYPKRFPKATNGLLVVDYSGRKEYRIFVATEGGQIRGYLKDGTALPGWNPKDNVGTIFTPIQHELVDGKDYLMTQTEEGSLHLFARNGDARTPPIRWNSTFNNRFGVDVTQTPYRIVSADVNGNTFVTNFNGKLSVTVHFSKITDL
ncbi:MAG: hypothetical protein AAF598_08500 [Bacteroidota bacterium]